MMAPKLITCSICDRAFSKRFSLNRHMSSMHQITPVVARRSIVCPVSHCGSQFPYQGPLRAHLKDAHEVTLEDIEINFVTMEAFYEWKRREEESFSLKYVKACGTQRLMGGVEVYRFNCFRTGMYNPEGKGLRRLKAQGSCKIGASCPSTITAHRKLDGKVTCSYCMTHVGHDVVSSKTRRAFPLKTVKPAEVLPTDTTSKLQLYEAKVKTSKMTQIMLRSYQLFSDFDLSTDERVIICNAIAQNKSLDEIFDRVRKTVHGDTDREFNVLVNNLKKLNRYMTLNDLMTDFQSLTEQCNASQEIPVVFYEGLISDNEGETSDTFILVVMNSYQVEILKYFGHQGIVCIDPVYSMDESGFISIALYVCSAQGDWILCGLCFCQSFNYATMKAFFNQVFIRTGALHVKTLITEDVDAIYAAWINVMGEGPDLILSAWHIDHKLRTKLKSLTFTDYAKLACLYRLFRQLVETTSEDKFNAQMNVLSRQSISNMHLSNINKFINDIYIWRKYQWAKYCRSETERNALSSAEAAHLLACRISHVEDLNLGQTLFITFQYYKKKCLKSLMNLNFTFINSDDVNGQITCPNLNDLGDVYVSRVESQNAWTLLIGEASYDIVLSDKSCSELCDSRCVDCQVCIHRFLCSCVESVIQWKFCKHIHLIGHHLLNSGEVLVNDDDTNEIVNEDEENEISMGMLLEFENAAEKEAEETSLKEELPITEKSEPVENVAEDSEDNVETIISCIENTSQEILLRAKNVKTRKHLQGLYQQMKSVLSVAQALTSEDEKPTDEVLLKLATLEDHNYAM